MAKLKMILVLLVIVLIGLVIPGITLLGRDGNVQLPTRIAISKSNTVMIRGSMGENILQTQQQMQFMIANNPDLKLINIYIDSPGGGYTQETQSMIAYMEYLKLNGTTLRCVVGNIAASLATVILSHCNERYAFAHSVIMFHGARFRGQDGLNAVEAERLAAELHRLDASVWAFMKDIIDDEDYWDENFAAERLIPAPELAVKNPRILTIIDSAIVVE